MTKPLLFALVVITLLTSCTLRPASPTPPPPTATPIPVSLTGQRQAMRPAHTSEVDQIFNQRAPSYRLDVTVVPESLAPPAKPYVLGLLRVHYTNNESVLLNQIYLRLFPNTPSYNGSMRVTQVLVNQQVVEPSLIAQNATLGIPLSGPLEPGQSVDLQLSYEASLPTTVNDGFALFNYSAEVLTLAGFYPVIPVFDAEGWQIDVAPTYGDAAFTDIAFYEVNLTVPSTMTVAATGSTLRQIDHADGTTTHHIFSGPVRDFQVVLSEKFASLSQPVNDVTVTSYFPAGAEEKGQFALEVAAESLRVFEALFGPYPYREFDVVAAPTSGSTGGVEYPGLVIIAERYYYEDNDFMEFIIAHEVAHQWWYGLVGNNPLTAPWLDEALTNYSTVHYYEARYGPSERTRITQEMFVAPHNLLKVSNADLPIGGAVGDYPAELYQPIVYGKGPLFFDEVRTLLGDAAYLAALNRYAEQYRYGIAQPADLLAIFGQAGQAAAVEAVYETWVLP